MEVDVRELEDAPMVPQWVKVMFRDEDHGISSIVGHDVHRRVCITGEYWALENQIVLQPDPGAYEFEIFAAKYLDTHAAAVRSALHGGSYNDLMGQAACVVLFAEVASVPNERSPIQPGEMVWVRMADLSPDDIQDVWTYIRNGEELAKKVWHHG
jgi:hypothetical protein